VCLLSSTQSIKSATQEKDVYRIGAGIADITGPAAEINMMGYAQFRQDASGIHFRLYARTFIVEDNDGNRVVYVNCDLGMIDQALKTRVSEILSQRYNGIYHFENVLISGTHTHSGPGGFLQYLLYTIVSQGFNEMSFNAIVDGIVRSVERAHVNLKPGKIYFKQGELLDASINRSPVAYLNNTQDEKKKYSHDTDKDFFLMKFVDLQGHPLGILTWFAVHANSMNNTNGLISGDNKGYAAMLFEMHQNGPNTLPGKGPFVAAFSNSNLGDVSPNLKGPKCQDTGLPCDGYHSTCNDRVQMCWASGPGRDMFESTKIIAERQYEKALELFDSTSDEDKVSGPVAYVHQHVDMSNYRLTTSSGENVTTCPPAYGYSMAAGTVDGPGAFDFKQGTTTDNKFWNFVRNFLSKPTKELEICQHPKPILLATGQMHFPWPWSPTVLPTQIIRIGNVFIPAVPGEFTTMAGRRMKNLIKSQVQKSSTDKVHVPLAGLSNAYSSYITTFEEYQVQRYEGGSTIFGPHTLEAYLIQYKKLAQSLISETSLPSGPSPPNFLGKQKSFRIGVIFDTAPFGKNFGDVLEQPKDTYTPDETVSAVFVAGHPQNNLMTESTYLTIEQKVIDLDTMNESWKIIRTDSSLDTKFIWKRTVKLLGQSIAQVEWTIPSDIKLGEYRIRHFGSYKSMFQQIKSYTGVTNTFQVVPKKHDRLFEPAYYE